MNKASKTRAYHWRTPQWLPSERDSKDESHNKGCIAYGRTHFKLTKNDSPDEWGATCANETCNAHGVVKLKGTLVEKEMNGENAEQPIPLPKCACVKENRLMRIYGSSAYEVGTKKNRKKRLLVQSDGSVYKTTQKLFQSTDPAHGLSTKVVNT